MPDAGTARRLAILALTLLLAACGADSVYAPDQAVSRARYSSKAPPSLTLITVINNRSGAGGHAALMIDADERVIFDPAGSWHHSAAPERNDVHYGITPLMLDFYIDYHARETYRVVMHTVHVSPELAARAKALAEEAGPVPKIYCSQATSGILRQLSGFEDVTRSFFPVQTMNSFAALPGVVEEVHIQNDAAHNKHIFAEQEAAYRAATGGDQSAGR